MNFRDFPDETDWTPLFRPEILARGRACQENGAVRELFRRSGSYTVTAVVEGSRSYHVAVRPAGKGKAVTGMECDCPYADGGNACKHMAAVLFAVEAEKKAAAEEDDEAEKRSRSAGKPAVRLRQTVFAETSPEQDYRLRNLVINRIGVMERLRLPEEEIADYRKRYHALPDVRQQEIALAMEKRRYDEAETLIRELVQTWKMRYQRPAMLDELKKAGF